MFSCVVEQEAVATKPWCRPLGAEGSDRPTAGLHLQGPHLRGGSLHGEQDAHSRRRLEPSLPPGHRGTIRICRVDACPGPVGPAALHICTRPCPAAGGDPGSHGAGPKDTPSNRTRAFTANFPHTKFTPEEGTISMTEEQEAGDGDSFPRASVGWNILGLGPAGAGAWALPRDGR